MKSAEVTLIVDGKSFQEISLLHDKAGGGLFVLTLTCELGSLSAVLVVTAAAVLVCNGQPR